MTPQLLQAFAPLPAPREYGFSRPPPLPRPPLLTLPPAPLPLFGAPEDLCGKKAVLGKDWVSANRPRIRMLSELVKQRQAVQLSSGLRRQGSCRGRSPS